MKTEKLQIRCKNNNKILNIDKGTSLFDIFGEFNLKMAYGPVSAKVNNKVVGLNYTAYHPLEVEFLDMSNASANRAYTRTLFFVLCKAVNDLYPNGKVKIDIPVSNGYYCDMFLGNQVTDGDVMRIKKRMTEIIDAHLPLERHECLTSEIVEMFEKQGEMSKVKLLKSIGNMYSVYYDLDGFKDFFYGSMLTNTRNLYLFDIVRYYDGILLRVPSLSDPTRLGELTQQDKMFEVFKEHHRKQALLGVSTVGDLNEAVKAGYCKEIINVSEALQEKTISRIADKIEERGGVKVVLIAGPSSSGKTTFSKRLSIQLLASGIRPIPISLDDYFLDREKTPRDKTGEFDYESLYALNIPLLNEQLKQLFAGEEVELPRYDFHTGMSVKSGKRLKLDSNQVLILEGIHALNPELTAQIPDEQKFKVYASALTTIMLDDHNYIPTTDNRLLRRIIRDAKYRGVSAEQTIHRWASVRAGENKWIFPFQENADEMFNTAMIYELGVIRKQAEPLLENVPETAEEYSEAYRLLKFLKHFRSIEEHDLPLTSLLREFLGGSSFEY